MSDDSTDSEPESEERRHGTRSRGIYLLPNLFTTAALFSGFYAVVAAMDGRFIPASAAIFIAMIWDGLDGRVARMTGTSSDFGKEYDSLSDMVSFGLAPALVMYQWAFVGQDDLTWAWSKLGWLAAFFYAVMAAMRLARFNSRSAVQDKRFFQGLPSPPAAGVIAGMVWLGADLGITGAAAMVPSFIITIAVGALMVSNISYYSFKDVDLGGRVPFQYLILFPLILIVIAVSPSRMLFLLFGLLAMSGPALSLWRWRRRRAQAAAGTQASATTSKDDPEDGASEG
jgi:CDP-diacylglycerol--serine O-phosphatidyltransferase